MRTFKNGKVAMGDCKIIYTEEKRSYQHGMDQYSIICPRKYFTG